MIPGIATAHTQHSHNLALCHANRNSDKEPDPKRPVQWSCTVLALQILKIQTNACLALLNDPVSIGGMAWKLSQFTPACRLGPNAGLIYKGQVSRLGLHVGGRHAGNGVKAGLRWRVENVEGTQGAKARLFPRVGSSSWPV